MPDGADKVHDRLEYRAATAIVRQLPTGLLLIFLGLFLLALVDLDRVPAWTSVGIGLCFVLGSGVIGQALWTRVNPGKPLFALSPEGVHYRIPWVKEVLVPWHEIEGVDTIDVSAGSGVFLWSGGVPVPSYTTAIYRNVTVLLVSKRFYDTRIHVGSVFLRGPGWSANFVPKGSRVQIALHHELVSVEARALRDAVEARWRAFRDPPAPEPPRTSAPVSHVVAMGASPKLISGWDAVQITVLLIGIAAALANLAGLWEAPGQSETRAARAKARELRKYWDDANRRMQEEWKEREAREKERQKDFDETMRRAFGD